MTNTPSGTTQSTETQKNYVWVVLTPDNYLVSAHKDKMAAIEDAMGYEYDFVEKWARCVAAGWRSLPIKFEIPEA